MLAEVDGMMQISQQTGDPKPPFWCCRECGQVLGAISGEHNELVALTINGNKMVSANITRWCKGCGTRNDWPEGG